MAAAALVTHDGHVELLLPDLDMHELLQVWVRACDGLTSGRVCGLNLRNTAPPAAAAAQGPVHQLSVLQGVCTLYYTTAGAGYAFAEVRCTRTHNHQRRGPAARVWWSGGKNG
jgi:uncharacterized ParB-like nuclease family protein